MMFINCSLRPRGGILLITTFAPGQHRLTSLINESICCTTCAGGRPFSASFPPHCRMIMSGWKSLLSMPGICCRIAGISCPLYTNVEASIPRRVSLGPKPRTNDVPMMATCGTLRETGGRAAVAAYDGWDELDAACEGPLRVATSGEERPVEWLCVDGLTSLGDSCVSAVLCLRLRRITSVNLSPSLCSTAASSVLVAVITCFIKPSTFGWISPLCTLISPLSWP